MATETEHLHLIRPDPDDYYDITQFNRNMDILDQWIGSVQDRISYVLTASASGGNLTITPKDGRTEPEDGTSCLICLPEELAAGALLAFSDGTSYPIYLPSGKPVTQGTAAAGAYIHVVFNQSLGRWYLIGGAGGKTTPHVFIQKEEPEADSCIWIKPTDESWSGREEISMREPWCFIQNTEPQGNSCFWIKPLDDSGFDGTLLLETSDSTDSNYFAEIGGEMKAIENAVDTDAELDDGNFRLEL